MYEVNLTDESWWHQRARGCVNCLRDNKCHDFYYPKAIVCSSRNSWTYPDVNKILKRLRRICMTQREKWILIPNHKLHAVFNFSEDFSHPSTSVTIPLVHWWFTSHIDTTTVLSALRWYDMRWINWKRIEFGDNNNKRHNIPKQPYLMLFNVSLCALAWDGSLLRQSRVQWSPSTVI